LTSRRRATVPELENPKFRTFPATISRVVNHRKAKIMKTSTRIENRQLEEFLEELVLHIDRPEAIDVLLGILTELKRSSFETNQKQPGQGTPAGASPDRYDIFKMSPDRIVRIGFVRGAENAKRVLPGLHSLGGSLYFLHQSGAAWRLVNQARVAS